MTLTPHNITVQIRTNLGTISNARLNILKEVFTQDFPVQGNGSTDTGLQTIAFTNQKDHVFVAADSFIFMYGEGNFPNWGAIKTYLVTLVERLAFDVTGFGVRIACIIDTSDSFSRSIGLLREAQKFQEALGQETGVGLRLFLPVLGTPNVGELKVEPLLNDRQKTVIEFSQGSIEMSDIISALDSCKNLADIALEKYIPSILDLLPNS